MIQLGELLSTRMSVDSVKIVQNMVLKHVDLFRNMLSLVLSKDGVPFLSDKIHEADFSWLFIAEISKLSNLNSFFFFSHSCLLLMQHEF